MKAKNAAGLLLLATLALTQIASRPHITPNMKAEDVRRLYGLPAQRVTRATQKDSLLNGYHYENGLHADHLPPISREAWLYPYGPLGTTCLLVYFDSSGKVERVYQGGT